MINIREQCNKTATQCNLFCASRTGQIQHILQLIEEYHLCSNRLIILVTEIDTTLLLNIRSAIPSGAFDQVSVATLPAYPASRNATYFKHKKVFKAISSAVCEATADVNSVDLYLCHVNNYYHFLSDLLRKQGKLASLNLVEEGLSTYKWSIVDKTWGAFNWDESLDGAISPEAAKTQAKKVAKRAGDFAKKLLLFWVPVVKAFLSLLFELLLLLAIFLSKPLKKNLLTMMCEFFNKLMPRRYRYGLVEEVDNGYFCFPEKMTKVHEFKIFKLNQISFCPDPLPETLKTDLVALPNNIPLFATQKYGEYDTYFHVVFDLLEEMGVKDVYFKFHPREQIELIRPIMESALKAHPSITIYNVPALDGVSVETLVANHAFSEIIGLTTSALLYAPLVSPHTKAVSIAEEFISKYLNKGREIGSVSAGYELKELSRDYSVFKQVAPDIKQYNPSEREK